MLILMVTFGQQYDCTAGDLVMGISGLPRLDQPKMHITHIVYQENFQSILPRYKYIIYIQYKKDFTTMTITFGSALILISSL